jgi:hypothetical protein
MSLSVSRDLHNVIGLLDSETRVHDFRYFVSISTVRPDLTYLREVVDILMPNVAGAVMASSANQPSDAVVLKLTVSKPEKK